MISGLLYWLFIYTCKLRWRWRPWMGWTEVSRDVPWELERLSFLIHEREFLSCDRRQLSELWEERVGFMPQVLILRCWGAMRLDGDCEFFEAATSQDIAVPAYLDTVRPQSRLLKYCWAVTVRSLIPWETTYILPISQICWFNASYSSSEREIHFEL